MEHWLWCNVPILDAPWLANGESIDGNIVGGLYIHDFNVQSLLSEHSKCWYRRKLKICYGECDADVYQLEFVCKIKGSRVRRIVELAVLIMRT